jgi:hypothetical protein
MFDTILLAQQSSQAPAVPTPVTPSPPVPPGSPPVPPEGWLDQFLAFVYTFAHWIGGLTVNLLQQLLPLQEPEKLVDPIGYLVLLTVLLIVAEVAKKIAWLVVVIGWLLIIVRIVLEAIPTQT